MVQYTPAKTELVSKINDLRSPWLTTVHRFSCLRIWGSEVRIFPGAPTPIRVRQFECAMASRPCRSDADTKWLWKTLFPGTPFPACDASEAKDGAAGESTATGADRQDHRESDEKRRPSH